jgi:uncharacterized membrane-anchored protein
MNAIAAFWFAYIVTRPLGASFADWFSKRHAVGGLALGDGTVSAVLSVVIVGLVAYLTVTRRDVQSRDAPVALSPAPSSGTSSLYTTPPEATSS